MTRAEFASRIELINQMANFMTRTRRRDVEELRIVREPITPLLTMHEEERRFYDEVTNTVKEYALDCDTNERFLLSTPQRLLTSSPAAASMYWTNYREHDSDQVEETDDDLIQDGDNDRPLVARLARLARTLDMTDRLEQLDTKFQLLLAQFHQLCQSDPDAKIIIFSSFKPTLHYLQRRLMKEGINCELLHGSISSPHSAILERFRENVAIRVLLSSEVGSEGVDLQFCWVVVN